MPKWTDNLQALLFKLCSILAGVADQAWLGLLSTAFRQRNTRVAKRVESFGLLGERQIAVFQPETLSVGEGQFRRSLTYRLVALIDFEKGHSKVA